MKKLFKEVWKSFSKSKIILVGLIILIFLTSGIITLIFDVVNSYTIQYNNYKKKSGLQDVTMNSNLNLYGSSPSNFYIKSPVAYDGEQYLLDNQWKHIEPKQSYADYIQINTNSDYYKINELIAPGLLDQDVYVRTKDLSNLLNLSLNIGKITSPKDPSDVHLTLDPNGNNKLDFFLKSHTNENSNEILSITNLKDTYDTASNTWTSSLNPKNLIISNFFGASCDEILINIFTHEAFIKSKLLSATTSKEYAQYQANPNNFIVISSSEVAKMLGFVNNKLDATKQWILEGNIPSEFNGITLSQFVKKTLPNLKSTFNLLTPTKAQISLSEITIPNKWFVYSQYNYFYTKNTLTLEGIIKTPSGEFLIDHSQWTGYYKEYLEKLKSQPDFKDIYEINFWNKAIRINHTDFEGNIINVTDQNGNPIPNETITYDFNNVVFTLSDLNKTVVNKDGVSKKLADVAGVEQNQEGLLKISTNPALQNEETIHLQAKENKYKQVYEEFQKITKEMAIRETLTVNSNNSESNNVYHFINLGNSLNEINWYGNQIKQELGKLSETQLDSPIFNLPSNINATASQVPIKYVPSIIEQLLTGLSLNRDYINPMISFNQFEYTQNNQVLTQSQAKIIWLTVDGSGSENAKADVYGIAAKRDLATSKKTYFILKNNIKQPNPKWTCIEIFYSFKDVANYIETNNLNFAPFDLYGNPLQVVSSRGWARQDNNYIDKYSIPFQYYLPSSDLIKEFNSAQQNPSLGKYGMEIFRDNLINTLTQSIRHLVPASLWRILMEGINTAFSKYGFGDGLKPPAALTTETILRVCFGVFRDAITSTNEAFANPLLANILNGIKRTFNPDGTTPLEVQKQQFKIQINKFAQIVFLTTGMDISAMNISEKINDPSLFIDGLNEVLSSFNLDNLVLDIWNNFFANTQNTENKIFNTGDFMPYIYKNVYSFDSLKDGLVKVLQSTVIGNLTIQELLGKFPPGSLGPIDQIIGLIPSAILNTKIYDAIKWLGFKDQIEGYNYIKSISAIQNVQINNETFEYNATKKWELLNLMSLKVPVAGPITMDIIPLIVKILPKDEYLNLIYNPKQSNPLELDMDLMWYLTNYVFVENKKPLELFGVDLSYFLTSATSSFVEIKDDYNQITMTENIGKVAIINEAFLKNNDKEVYISSSLEKDLEDISKIDDKFKININDVEFVIVGTDITVDYMYPVINAENTTVNTKTQSLVYVNQYGFDRIKRSNPSAPYEKYFLFSANDNQSPSQLQTLLNELVYETITGEKYSGTNINSDKNVYKVAYLTTETSLLNPERALRITIIDQMINNLKNAQKIVGIALSVIVALVVIFVIRRYIGSRSKALGILKAQGYTSWEIALSICLFPLFVSVIGATLGYMVGLIAQYGIFKLFSIFWTLPTAVISFNWVTFLVTLIAPIILLCALTVATTFWFLHKNKPMAMMNGSMEVNDSYIARTCNKLAAKTSVKNRFSLALATGSIGKLIALFISSVFTAGIILFYVAQFKTFNLAVNKTYANKNFKYMISYTTPTIEGGNVQTYRFWPKNSISNLTIDNLNTENYPILDDINNMLYVPVGDVSEGYVYYSDYFKPGYNPVINKNGKNGDVNPDDTTTPHIFTKASIDMTVEAGNLSINVWKNLYNAIPESQRALIISRSEKSNKWLEWTQEGKIYHVNNKDYITKFDNYNTDDECLVLWDPVSNSYYEENGKRYKVEYFDFKVDQVNPENSKFIFRSLKQDVSLDPYVDKELVINGKPDSEAIRTKYRKFLVDGYNLMFTYNTNPTESPDASHTTPMPPYELDYFISPGAIFLSYDETTKTNDETFTYIDAISQTNTNITPRINGYSENSQYVSIKDDQGNNLIKKANEFNENGIYPLIINKVVAEKYGLNENDYIKLQVNNRSDRYYNNLKELIKSKVSNPGSELDVKSDIFEFKIIGLSDTYINDEWITSKKVANKILGLESNGYNGIISNLDAPITIANSLPLYSSNGYWSADNKIATTSRIDDLSNSEVRKLIQTYREIFYDINENDNSKTNISIIAKLFKSIYPTYNNDQINTLIKNVFDIVNLDISYVENADNKANARAANNAIKEFVKIYSDDALSAFLDSAIANGVEKEYIIKTSSTIDQGFGIVIIITFVISLTILIMITSMIINENERNIAIFGILGYTTKEKIAMFFSIYVPVVFLSMIVAGLIVWLVIPTMLSTVLASTSILLPMSLSFIHILIAFGILSFVFATTCMIAWIVQGRVKPIMLLKEI